MKQELERRQSSKERILALLIEQGAVLNTQLNEIAYRYGGRIHELRREGHSIRREIVGCGLYRYVYEGKKHIPADLNTVTAGDGRLF